MTVPLASTLEQPTAVLPSSKALTWKSVRAKPSHRAIEPFRGLPNTHLPTVANEQGSFTTPSFVSFTSEERLIGEAAKNQAAMNPVNTIFDVK
jgi:Hsp70 protein